MIRMKQAHIKHKFVEFIPESLDDGILYISRRYSTAAHKCCCGCGEEVITPLTPTDWSLKVNGYGVTMSPSIGNWNFTCQSHYLIKRNKIVWAGHMSQQEIKRGRAIDLANKQVYFKAVNTKKKTILSGKTASKRNSSVNKNTGILIKMWNDIKRFWNYLMEK